MKMSLTVTKSGKFNKSETKLNFIEIARENSMNECLISTKIFKNNKNDYEEYLRFDPSFVADMRHKMFQQSSEMFLISEIQNHCEALKILRLENHHRVLQKKESKIIEKEITKLKEILEKHRFLTKKEIDQTTHKKIKFLSHAPKFSKYFLKLPKEMEYYDIVHKINGFLQQKVYITTESDNSQQKISLDTRAILKKNEQTEKILEPVFNCNNSITEFGIENEKHSSEVVQGNNEIIETFSGKGTKGIMQESLNDIKKKFKSRKEIEIQTEINQKILKHAWRAWKTFTQQIKNRRKEKTIYTCKIESFLSYLQEKTTHLKRETSLKHEIKRNLTLENRVKIAAKQTIRKENEEKLKKLMLEVKTSQADTKIKLQEITKSNSMNERKFSNYKFLQNIEKRRQERMKCRKEIQEKKLNLKEEMEKARIEKEEKNRKEKQTRLEELKKKRRLEKEKKEKLKLNWKLAENHYETYLLRAYGWRPWAMLLKVRDLKYQHAVVFYEKRVTQKILRRWMAYVQEHLKIVILNVEKFYKNTLKKKCLLTWKKFLERKKNQNQAAIDWNEYKITERAFKNWLQFTQHEILEYLNKKEKVKLLYERKLKTKFLKKIKAYPEFRKLKQAKEMRKRIWRQKIKKILPDYQPIDISE